MPDFLNPIHNQTDGQWLRPRTTRRYLHPPKSERMFTLWAEGKIIFGQVDVCSSFSDYPKLNCSGIWLVHTKYARPFDFRKTENYQATHDVPIHGIRNTFGGFAVDLEAFCDTKRKSTCFSKITVTNTAPYRVSDWIGLMVRSGKEKDLVHGSPDEYLSYMPEAAEFRLRPATFREENGVLRDGDVFVTVSSDAPTSYNDQSGILWIKLDLEAGEQSKTILSFGKGESAVFDYDQVKAEATSFWIQELNRIRNIPAKIQKDVPLLSTLRRNVVQILQSCCYYVGTDYFVMRQGGLQRLIWPWEAMPAMEALGKLGDFSDYLESILSFYFDDMHQPNGEIKTFGEGWASVTSSCLYSLAVYCLQTGKKALWLRYRDRAFKTFRWIQEKRRESEGMGDAFPGLFPPLRGSDWPHVLQHWTNTDSFATYALNAFAEAAERFGDPEASIVREEYLDYRNTLKTVFDRYNEQYGRTDEMRVPLTPAGNDQALLDDFYPYLQQGAPLYAIVDLISVETAEKVLAYHKRVGLYKNGLNARMPYRNGDTHIWYTSATDYNWFRIWNHFGKTDEMQRIVDAQLRYSMTEEGYMLERYADNDPYYIPWSPNISASGRLLNMLLANYKD